LIISEFENAYFLRVYNKEVIPKTYRGFKVNIFIINPFVNIEKF
jgi:hypothetical protein